MSKQDLFPAGLVIAMIATGMIGLLTMSLLIRFGVAGLPACVGALFVNYLAARQLVVSLRRR